MTTPEVGQLWRWKRPDLYVYFSPTMDPNSSMLVPEGTMGLVTRVSPSSDDVDVYFFAYGLAPGFGVDGFGVLFEFVASQQANTDLT